MKTIHFLVGLGVFVVPTIAGAALPSHICNHDVVVQNDNTHQMITYDCTNGCNVVWKPNGDVVVTDTNGGAVTERYYDIPVSQYSEPICPIE